jgi:hypothetical protein
MGNSKKTLLICIAFIFLEIFFIYSVSALQDYDQRVYKVSSSYSSSEEEIHQNHYFQEYYGRGEYSQRDYGIKENCASGSINKIHYTQYAFEDTRKSVFGDYVKEYSAYVTNKGRTGRDFTVVFTLEDKNGYEFTQSVTQYLRIGEKKKFVYRDIQYERDEILDWTYKVIPQR